VLSRHPTNPELYYIVDGQQRITTLTMIINAIIHELPEKDSQYFHRFYIEEDRYRLKHLGKDKDFFLSLLSNKDVEPANKSQRLLKGAYGEIERIVAREKDKLKLLKAIESSK